VANSLNNLAVLLANQGRVREAADAFEDAYERHRALFGEQHWRTLNTMRNVGVSMLLLDRPGECEQWLTKALERHEAVGTKDRFTTYMRAQLARCLIRGGQVDKGTALLDWAVNELGKDGPDAADYHANAQLWLGTALLDSGQVERAERLVAAAVEHQRRTRHEDHPARAEAECELAHVFAARRKMDAALSLVEACVPHVAAYGQMVPWRKRSAEQLLQQLRASAR